MLVKECEEIFTLKKKKRMARMSLSMEKAVLTTKEASDPRFNLTL